MRSRNRVLLAVGSVATVVAVAILISCVSPPTPVAVIRVTDAKGRPVAGATITPDGLRPKQGGAHYGWSGDFVRSGVPARRVQTDADGFARVAYPFYADEKLETGEISFAVDHPDYCASRPFRTVASSPPANAPILEKFQYLGRRLLRRVQARPDPVVLQLGAVVRVRGYVETKANVVTNLHAEISNEWPAGTNFWRRDGPLLWSRKAGAALTFLRALWCPAEGVVMFSEAVSFPAKAGETNEFLLELKRGARVAGRLDESVPRPVRDGRVCLRLFVKDGDRDAPVWIGWRPVADDGSFVFASLPDGRIEMIGLCDGFVSKNGGTTGGRATGHRLPQLFDVAGADREITLAMELAATCEVTVLDDAGRPLAGARASFGPNVLWGGNGATIFAEDLFNLEDFYQRGRALDGATISAKTREQFCAPSDARGVATVRNLPAGDHSYRAIHTNYDMPIHGKGTSGSRSASVLLAPGETGRVAVTMQKKGTAALTH